MVPKPTVSDARVVEAAAVDAGSLTAWTFDAKRLSDLAVEHRGQYRAAQPFPHIVLDGLFPDALVAELAANFPEPDDRGWMRLQYEFQQKLQWIDTDATPPVLEAFIAMMNSSR